MRISFRLAELLQQQEGLERGIIKRIAEATSLERHQVAAVMNNRAKYVSLGTLAALCEYLIEHHQVDRADLPGVLFRIEPEEFSALASDRKYVELCVGMWTDKRSPGADGGAGAFGSGVRRRWMMASDSYLLGNLLHELFRLGNQRRPERLQQRLVSAFVGLKSLEAIAAEARAVHREFREKKENCGLICLGSVKSNVVIEPVVAGAFGAEPFVPQDDVERPDDRRCPFFFRYRDDDVQPPSCHGGLRLARGEAVSAPGIYVQTAHGWEAHPCDDRRDAALVFYTYHVPVARLEMVIGGFSGRATHCLASGLRAVTRKLWPPPYDNGALQVGAFAIRFEFEPGAGDALSGADADWISRPSRTQIIPLEAEVLRRKIER